MTNTIKKLSNKDTNNNKPKWNADVYNKEGCQLSLYVSSPPHKEKRWGRVRISISAFIINKVRPKVEMLPIVFGILLIFDIMSCVMTNLKKVGVSNACMIGTVWRQINHRPTPFLCFKSRPLSWSLFCNLDIFKQH